MKRFILLVLDSVGVGELPDAALYGDEGSNTLANTAAAVGGLSLPNLERWGLGNIAKIKGVRPQANPQAAWGRMAEVSSGKDTTTGHWELAGLQLMEPFPTYPQGFPDDIIEAFERQIGRPILGNYPASGTKIIEELGVEHMATGSPIVYTSADSVFQIACHEEVVPVERLYEWCRIARRLLAPPHGVGRVIARPFVGKPGAFVRTKRRRDFSLEPVGPTVLDFIRAAEIEVWGVGKIHDIFAEKGISRSFESKNNMETIDAILEAMDQTTKDTLIFANCVDFDMIWGHRNDVAGYAAGLEELDARLPEIERALGSDDLLCVTADHGCDPTTPSTDHSREYVPLLVLGSGIKPRPLGTRSTFCDVAKSIAEFFQVRANLPGCSFLSSGPERRI